MINTGNLESLYENDQLNLQMVAGLAFPFYSEARITFPPTYKFDIGTDEYDSSEKARIPAWTDRILRKGSNLKQLAYNSAPLRFSDHRPVYAVFQCLVSMVDEELRQTISEELYRRRKADVGEATANLETESTDDEELMGYDAIEPGLPPASSDRQKWWLDNGQPARASIAPPKAANGTSMVLNPNRPPNPFTPTDEPDWVSVPRSSSKQSLSSMSTSPFEIVNVPTSVTSMPGNPGPRVLPPPFDPFKLPAKVGRLNIPEETRKAESPPPPPPRRQTAVSNQSQPLHHRQTPPAVSQPSKAQTAPPPPPSRGTSSATLENGTVSKKTKSPPPPVAKKPSHLATTSPTMAALSLDGVANGTREDEPSPIIWPPPPGAGEQIPSRSSTNVIKKAAPPPKPPKPSPAASHASQSGRPAAAGRPTGAVALPGLIGTGVGGEQARLKPAVPAKIYKKAPPGSLDLLGDDGGDGASTLGGWETLKPS